MIDLTQLAIQHCEADPQSFAIILPHLKITAITIQGHEPPDSMGWVFVRPSEIPDGMEACCAHLCQEVEAKVNALPSIARFAILRDDITFAASQEVNRLRSERRVQNPIARALRHIQILQNAATVPNETQIEMQARSVRRQAIQAIAHLILLLEVQPEWGAAEAFKRDKK